MTDVRTKTMREKELHMVGNPSARVRGEVVDSETIGRTESVLRPGDEAPRTGSARRAARRGKSAMGHALTFAGWFWLGFAVGLVLRVWEVWK